MACAAARELKDGELVFVGMGIPMVATFLAQKTHAPNLIMVVELGIVGSKTEELPKSLVDPALVKGATYACSMLHTLGAILPYVDKGFLGAAQIDKFGNLNSTVVGDYFNPKARLMGSGGANDIGAIAHSYIIMMEHERHRFVEKVSYITTIGHYKGGNSRKELGFPGDGPSTVISNLGVFRFDEETKELYLDSYHPGSSVEKVKENSGYDIKISLKVKDTPFPTKEEQELLKELDPLGIYLR